MVVLKAMARESRVRYATAQEFSDDLGRFLNGQPVLARPRKAIPPLLVAAAMAVILIGAGAIWFATRPKTSEVVAQITPQAQAPLQTPAQTPTQTPAEPTPPVVTAEAPKSEAPKVEPPAPKTALPKYEIPSPVVARPSPPPISDPIKAIPAAPVSSPELDDARDRFATISGKAAATEQLFQKIKADLEAKGLNIRADTLSRMTSMKLNLALAKENIDRGNAEAALRNLNVADALSVRVNKELGR